MSEGVIDVLNSQFSQALEKQPLKNTMCLKRFGAFVTSFVPARAGLWQGWHMVMHFATWWRQCVATQPFMMSNDWLNHTSGGGEGTQQHPKGLTTLTPSPHLPLYSLNARLEQPWERRVYKVMCVKGLAPYLREAALL